MRCVLGMHSYPFWYDSITIGVFWGLLLSNVVVFTVVCMTPPPPPSWFLVCLLDPLRALYQDLVETWILWLWAEGGLYSVPGYPSVSVG